MILLLLSGLVQPVVSLCQMILNEENMSAGMFFGQSAEAYFFMTIVIFVIIVPRICGWDAAEIANMCYQEFTGKALTFQFAFSNLLQVLDFGNYKFEYIGGKDIPVFVTAVSPSMATGIVCSSLLKGIVCIAIGHVVFCRQDMG